MRHPCKARQQDTRDLIIPPNGRCVLITGSQLHREGFVDRVPPASRVEVAVAVHDGATCRYPKRSIWRKVTNIDHSAGYRKWHLGVID
jgi:hypothetical protein